MLEDRSELREGARYRYRWTGALVRVDEVRDDATVFWRCLDDYRIYGHRWGITSATEFLSNFDQIGADYRFRKAG